MRKGEAESCNTDLRPGEGGFHCGNLWGTKMQAEYIGKKGQRCQNQRHELFRGVQKSAERKWEYIIILPNVYPEYISLTKISRCFHVAFVALCYHGRLSQFSISELLTLRTDSLLYLHEIFHKKLFCF